MTLNFEYILQKYIEITLLKQLLKREIRVLADFFFRPIFLAKVKRVI